MDVYDRDESIRVPSYVSYEFREPFMKPRRESDEKKRLIHVNFTIGSVGESEVVVVFVVLVVVFVYICCGCDAASAVRGQDDQDSPFQIAILFHSS